jgi:hypothetical protein
MNWFNRWFRDWFGKISTPAPSSGGAAIPAGGMKGKKRPEYGLVQYPERGLAFDLSLRVVQRKPTFTAHLECYVVPEAEGKIRQTYKIQASFGQRRARFGAALLQTFTMSMRVEQGRPQFSADVFMTKGSDRMPRWIEDIMQRQREEQADEEAILSLIFGRKL